MVKYLVTCDPHSLFLPDTCILSLFERFFRIFFSSLHVDYLTLIGIIIFIYELCYKIIPHIDLEDFLG